jgi:hypothetical protein
MLRGGEIINDPSDQALDLVLGGAGFPLLRNSQCPVNVVFCMRESDTP